MAFNVVIDRFLPKIKIFDNKIKWFDNLFWVTRIFFLTITFFKKKFLFASDTLAPWKNSSPNTLASQNTSPQEHIIGGKNIQY